MLGFGELMEHFTISSNFTDFVRFCPLFTRFKGFCYNKYDLNLALILFLKRWV